MAGRSTAAKAGIVSTSSALLPFHPKNELEIQWHQAYSRAYDLDRQRRFVEAADAFEASLPLARNAKCLSCELRTQSNLGGDRLAARQYRQAHAAFLAARRLAEQIGDQHMVGVLSLNLSNLYLHRFALAEAIAAAEVALDSLDDASQPWLRPKVLLQKARLIARQGDIVGATRIYRTVIAEASQRGDPTTEALAWDHLGLEYWRRSDLLLADQSLSEAFRLRTIHRDAALAASYLSLALLRNLQGDYASALHLADRAREEWLRRPTILSLWQVRLARGRALAGLHRDLEALAEIDTALDQIRLEGAELLLADSLRIAYGAGTHEVYAARIELGTEIALARGNRALLEESFRLAEEARAQSLRQSTGDTPSVPGHFFFGHAEAIDQLQRAQVELMRTNSNAARRALEHARRRLTEINAAAGLAARHAASAASGRAPSPSPHAISAASRHAASPPPHAASAASRRTASASPHAASAASRYAASPVTEPRPSGSVSERPPTEPRPSGSVFSQRFLSNDEALFSFYLGVERSYVWVVTRESFQACRLPPRARVAAAAADFTALVRSRDPAAARHAQQLYRMLFAEAGARVESKRRWLLSLDTELFDVPFAALLPSPGVYLVERHALELIPGGWALAPSGRNPWNSGMVALGDPVYNTADPRWAGVSSVAASLQLPRLIASAREIRACAREWNSGNRTPQETASLLEGRAATWDRLRAEIEQRRPAAIHVAAHFVGSPDDPRQVVMAFAINDRGESQYAGPEVITAFRHASRLVVLSGCGSGDGPTRAGEGRLGIARAWLVGGAQTVMATYWPTNDDAGQLIQEFYSLWRRTDGATSYSRPGDALQKAQIEMIRTGSWKAEPNYWASYFVITKN